MIDKKLLRQACEYFRAPEHEATEITRLQFLQDLWVSQNEDDPTFKFVERLIKFAEDKLGDPTMCAACYMVSTPDTEKCSNCGCEDMIWGED